MKPEKEFIKMLVEDNKRLKKAGHKLAEASIRVANEYDGVHRLMLAVSEWTKVVADESNRGSDMNWIEYAVEEAWGKTRNHMYKHILVGDKQSTSSGMLEFINTAIETERNKFKANYGAISVSNVRNHQFCKTRYVGYNFNSFCFDVDLKSTGCLSFNEMLEKRYFYYIDDNFKKHKLLIFSHDYCGDLMFSVTVKILTNDPNMKIKASKLNKVYITK